MVPRFWRRLASRDGWNHGEMVAVMACLNAERREAHGVTVYHCLSSYSPRSLCNRWQFYGPFSEKPIYRIHTLEQVTSHQLVATEKWNLWVSCWLLGNSGWLLRARLRRAHFLSWGPQEVGGNSSGFVHRSGFRVPNFCQAPRVPLDPNNFFVIDFILRLHLQWYLVGGLDATFYVPIYWE